MAEMNENEALLKRVAALEAALTEQKQGVRNKYFLRYKHYLGFALLFLLGAAWLSADNFTPPVKFVDGMILGEKDLNKNFNALGNRLVPVGNISAWHRDFAGRTLELPDSFMECNGQEITDQESPLFGETLPNLNGAPGVNSPGHQTPERMFLRGGMTSGDAETDMIKDHGHGNDAHGHVANTAFLQSNNTTGSINNGNSFFQPNTSLDNPTHLPRTDIRTNNIIATITQTTINITGPTGPGVRPGSETRPKSMSVIWIMRIK